MPGCNSSAPIDSTLTAKAPAIHSHLVTMIESLPHFAVLQEDTRPIEAAAVPFKAYNNVVVLGTGGSSLGAQTLCAIAQHNAPTLHFMDNIDARQFCRVIGRLKPEETAIIAVSKSGNTAETLMQLLTVQALWPHFKWAERSLIVTENKPTAIRELAQAWGIHTLDHPADIGGRYSAFTLVGLLPAAIAGVDIAAVRRGALEVINTLPTLKPQECAPVVSAIQHAHFMHHGVNQSVMLAYSEALNVFGAWYAQLWGESLGKQTSQGQRVGTTPVRALGAVDQHSQLQLYLDGPRDKFFTVLTLEDQGLPPVVQGTAFAHPALQCFEGKTMGDLMRAEQKATVDTLTAKGCYVRHMHIQSWDAENIGALMAHFILETLATAYVLEVNPFDQPAVEDGKKLALEYLKAMPTSAAAAHF